MDEDLGWNHLGWILTQGLFKGPALRFYVELLQFTIIQVIDRVHNTIALIPKGYLFLYGHVLMYDKLENLSRCACGRLGFRRICESKV